MPVSDPLLDPLYAELISELRDARTPTPATLQTRVDELLVRRRPVPYVRRDLPRPRLRLVLAVAGGCTLLVAGIVAASRAPSPTTTSADSSFTAASSDVAAAAAATAAVPAATQTAVTGEEAAALTTASAIPSNDKLESSSGSGGATDKRPTRATDVPAAGDANRLQHQTARLTIALQSSDDVSEATGQVTRAITSYGGHIVTVQFATPEGAEARSEIVAKVPIERMQEATDRFTALGRLAGAQVDISDLQERADSLEQRVASARLQIARFDAQLAATDLSKLQRATLVERRARARQRLADLNANVARTRQDAALADLVVILVTDDRVVVPTKSGSDAGDKAREALGVLADVGVVALYAVIVAAPLLLLVALLAGGRRLLRRRRDRRLLETA